MVARSVASRGSLRGAAFSLAFAAGLGLIACEASGPQDASSEALVASDSAVATPAMAPTSNGVVIVGLTLSPTSATVAPGGTVTFQPLGWVAGSDTPVMASVTWSATGGTISPAGVFTAGSQTGNFAVKATSTTTAHTESASVTIAGSPVTPTISSVAITPATVALAFAGRQQFSAVATLSNGSTQSNPTLTWTATGGTISRAGLFTAGNSAGSFRVIGVSTNGKADTSAVTVTAATLTSLSLTPASVSLASRATRQFAVAATWSNGTTTVPPVTYTATGGTISTSGLYTAGATAGSYRVIVKHTAGTRADTSAVTITAAAPVLTGLSLTPASVSLATNGSQQFTVAGTWNNGSTTVPPVTYAATGGSISSNGLYMAGGTAGSYRVIASHTGGTLKDTSVVVITGGSTGPTPLFSEGFEDGNIGSRGWFDASSVAVAAEGRPGSTGTKSMQWRWTTGATAPAGSARHDFTPTNSVYISYWIKQSSNWTGSGRDYHPHMFHVLTTADDRYIGPSRTHLTLYDELIYDPSRGGSVPYLSLQDALMINTGNLNKDLTNVTEQRAIGGYNGRPETNVTWDAFDYGGGVYTNYKIIKPSGVVMTDATKSQWHKVESYWQLNSISGGKGQPDGVVQYWFDGQLIVDRHDIYFRTAVNSSMQFRTFVMAPYIQDGSPRDQSIYIDDLIIAKSR